MTSDLYRRIFTRTRDPDLDVVASEDFRKANFKDFFGGEWLSQPENEKKTSYHEVLMDFYSKIMHGPNE
jgi:hypothetical protein